MKQKITLPEAAAALGRKGGKTTGKSKARLGTSAQVKKWWASPAAANRRKARPEIILQDPTANTQTADQEARMEAESPLTNSSDL